MPQCSQWAHHAWTSIGCWERARAVVGRPSKGRWSGKVQRWGNTTANNNKYKIQNIKAIITLCLEGLVQSPDVEEVERRVLVHRLLERDAELGERFLRGSGRCGRRRVGPVRAAAARAGGSDLGIKFF